MKPISGAILYKMFQFSLFELYFSWGIGILSLSLALLAFLEHGEREKFRIDWKFALCWTTWVGGSKAGHWRLDNNYQRESRDDAFSEGITQRSVRVIRPIVFSFIYPREPMFAETRQGFLLLFWQC